MGNEDKFMGKGVMRYWCLVSEMINENVDKQEKCDVRSGGVRNFITVV
jgi:hypothetical protein